MRGMESANGATIDWDALLEEARGEVHRGAGRGVSLQLVCDLLQARVAHYDWFGFYIAIPSQQVLVLGPNQGESTDHIRIPYGSGVCGRVARSGETLVIDDVRGEANYLACSIRVRSEIVVPVFHAGAFIAEIDIDSHRPAAFGAADRAFLTRLAAVVEAPLAELSARLAAGA